MRRPNPKQYRVDAQRPHPPAAAQPPRATPGPRHHEVAGAGHDSHARPPGCVPPTTRRAAAERPRPACRTRRSSGRRWRPGRTPSRREVYDTRSASRCRPVEQSPSMAIQQIAELRIAPRTASAAWPPAVSVASSSTASVGPGPSIMLSRVMRLRRLNRRAWPRIAPREVLGDPRHLFVGRPTRTKRRATKSSAGGGERRGGTRPPAHDPR